MKYLCNVNRTDNCTNRFEIDYTVLDVFMYFSFQSLFLMKHVTENFYIAVLVTRKKLDQQNYHEKKVYTHEIPTRKSFGPKNFHEKKIETHEIPTIK